MRGFPGRTWKKRRTGVKKKRTDGETGGACRKSKFIRRGRGGKRKKGRRIFESILGFGRGITTMEGEVGKPRILWGGGWAVIRPFDQKTGWV